MKKIDKSEMFQNVKSFLKAKGVDLQEGTYAERIQQGCGILTDTINIGQDALKRTKAAVDKGLDQVRQSIHDHTAPKTANPPPAAAKASANPPKAKAAKVKKAAPKKAPAGKVRKGARKA